MQQLLLCGVYCTSPLAAGFTGADGPGDTSDCFLAEAYGVTVQYAWQVLMAAHGDFESASAMLGLQNKGRYQVSKFQAKYESIFGACPSSAGAAAAEGAAVGAEGSWRQHSVMLTEIQSDNCFGCKLPYLCRQH